MNNKPLWHLSLFSYSEFLSEFLSRLSTDAVGVDVDKGRTETDDATDRALEGGGVS